MTKILVIDDDSEIRHLIREILQTDGYSVVEASDGRCGLECFHSEHPDLVITDMVMPGQDGVDVIMALHRDAPQSRVIAMSGNMAVFDFDLLNLARKLGAWETMRKPFRATDLVDRVHRCLGQE